VLDCLVVSVHPRHKREAPSRRPPIALGVVAAAAVVTVPVVVFGLASAHTSGDGAADLSATGRSQAQGQTQPPLTLDPGRYDGGPVSRSFDRGAGREADLTFQEGLAAQRATLRAVRAAHVKKWASADLNLWSSASPGAQQLGLLRSGARVLVTGRAADGRVEVVVRGLSRWVTAGYLSATSAQATAPVSAGLSMAPCPDGSVEYRLTPRAVYVYRSVCHAFPQITTYLGWDNHGEHVSGKAIDIMTSDVTLGTQIATFLQQHAAELHIYDILWRQHIWTPVRAAEGWRLLADRGSPTANHMNHVHVSVY